MAIDNVDKTGLTYLIDLVKNAIPTSLKSPKSIIVKLNSGTTEGTNMFTYDGSAAKTVNITPSGIGALASGGTASKATQLATERTINVQDASGTNTGTGASFNGTANATIKLPATIKATITGNCSGSSGSCTGNAATATKATQDGNGANIASTYAKKSDLSVLSATLTASGWSTSAPYTQTVTVSGVVANANYSIFVDFTGTQSTDEANRDALELISGGTNTTANSVTFYCYDKKPTTDVTIKLSRMGI